jgi:hypothetical protein
MRVVKFDDGSGPVAILDSSDTLPGQVIYEGDLCFAVARKINHEVDRLVYSAECQKIEHRPGKNSEEGKMFALLLGLPATYPEVVTANWLLNWGCTLNEALDFAQLA